MFVNPFHNDIGDEKDANTAEKLQTLDLEDSVASEKLLEITEKSLEASYIDELPSQNFDNKFFDPNQSDLNHSNLTNSNNIGRQPAPDRGRTTKNQQDTKEEARTSGGQLLHKARHERESEKEGLKNDDVKDLIKKYEKQSNKENRAKSESPKQFEPLESVKDLIKKFEVGRANQDAKTGQTHERSHSEEREPDKGVVSEMIQKFQRDIEARESAKQLELKQMEALRKTRVEAQTKLENQLLDDSTQKEVESSLEDRTQSEQQLASPQNLASNPFQMLSVDRQKESEEQFKGDLRETANFDPLVSKNENLNSHTPSDNQLKFNPFVITPSNDQENFLRPSGDFGFHKSHHNPQLTTTNKTELNEIVENPAEHRNSVFDDNEHKFIKQANNVYEENENSQSNLPEDQEDRWKYNLPQEGDYLMGVFDKNVRIIGIDRALEGDTEETKDYTQVGMPAFKNTFYKKDQDQSVSMNISKMKDYSMISQGRDQSQILRATGDTQERQGQIHLKLIDLNDIQQEKSKSPKNVIETPSDGQTNTKMNEAHIISRTNTGNKLSRSHDSQKQNYFDDSNVFNKIDKVIQDDNLLDDLNESQRQIIQDIDEEQKQNNNGGFHSNRAVSTNLESSRGKEILVDIELIPNKPSDNSYNYSPLAERVSSISRGRERRSAIPDQAEEQRYLTQGDIDFFNKFLDISVIPQFNENEPEFEIERLNSTRSQNQKLSKQALGSTTNLQPEKNQQSNHEYQNYREQEVINREIQSIEPLEAKIVQTKKKREFKIQQVEGLQYVPVVMIEQSQSKKQTSPGVQSEEEHGSHTNKEQQPQHLNQETETRSPEQKEIREEENQTKNISEVTINQQKEDQLNKSEGVQINKQSEIKLTQQQEAETLKGAINQPKAQGKNESPFSSIDSGLATFDRNKIRDEIRERMSSIDKELQRRKEGLNNLPTLGSYKRPQIEEPKNLQKNNNYKTQEKSRLTDNSKDKALIPPSSHDEAKKFVENFFTKNFSKGEIFKNDRKSNSPSLQSKNESFVSNQESNKYYFEPRGTESGTVTSKTNPFISASKVEPFRETLTLSSNTPLFQQVKQAEEGRLTTEKLRDTISADHAQRLISSADLQERNQQLQIRTNLSSSAGNLSSGFPKHIQGIKTAQLQYIKEETSSKSSSMKGENLLKDHQQSQLFFSNDLGTPNQYPNQGRETLGSNLDHGTIQSNQRSSFILSNQYSGSNRSSSSDRLANTNQTQALNTVSAVHNTNIAQHQQQNLQSKNQPQRITENYSMSNKTTTNQALKAQTTIANASEKGSEQIVSSAIKSQINEKEKLRPNPNDRQSMKLASKADTSAILDTSNINEVSISEEVQARLVPITLTKSNKPKYAAGQIPRTMFGYKVKEEVTYRPVEERKINMDVFCINCEEFVSIEEVDKHSQICTKKTEDLYHHPTRKGIFDSSESKKSDLAKVEDLNQKIERIIVKLNDASRSIAQGKLRIEFTDSLKRLVKVARDIVSEDLNPQLIQKKMREFDQIFGPLSSDAKGQEINLVIYLQRMFVTLKNKSDEFQMGVQNSNIIQLQEQLQVYERETLRRKAELELWQYQSEMLQDIQRNDARNMKYLRNELKKDVEILSQIHSEIESSADQSDDTVGTTESEVGLSLSRVQSKGTQVDRETLRRYFYTEAVNIKLTLPPNHPCRDLLISDLYDQVVAQNVPKEDYVKFIKQKYNLA